MKKILSMGDFLNEKETFDPPTTLNSITFNYNDKPLTFSGQRENGKFSNRQLYDNIMVWFKEKGYYDNYDNENVTNNIERIFTKDEIDKFIKENPRYAHPSSISKFPNEDLYYINWWSTKGLVDVLEKRLRKIVGVDINSIKTDVQLVKPEEISDDNDTTESLVKKIDFDIVFNYAFKSVIEDSNPVTINRKRSLFKIIAIKGLNIFFETSNGVTAPDYKISKNTIKDMYEKGINDTVLLSGNKGYYDGVLDFLLNKSMELSGKRMPEQEDSIKVKVKKSPFRQAICVIGESGAGKSVTIRKILEHDGHKFHFIIPTSTTTGLLSQFSPQKHDYVPSVLGEMILEASEHKSELYTAVFDECHKSNVIEMINDELLQCISLARNDEQRFITLDRNTIDLYKDTSGKTSLKTDRYNIYLPDNFGFIFISSKTKVIANNEDFFNRVEIVRLTTDDRSIITSEELINRILPLEEKNKLKTNNDF